MPMKTRSTTQVETSQKMDLSTNLEQETAGKVVVNSDAIFPPCLTLDLPDEVPQWFMQVRQNIQEQMNSMFKENMMYKSIAQNAQDTADKAASEAASAMKQIDILTHQNASLKQEVREINNKLILIESQTRRGNLLFDGIPETDNESWIDCEKKIVEQLTAMKVTDPNSIIFEQVSRMGVKSKDKTRTIVAKFSHFKDRERVWNARINLKGSKVWISEDFPSEIAKKRKQLYPILREALRQKKLPESEIKSASLKLDKLFINNRQFSVNNLDDLPPSLKPEKIATRVDPTKQVIAFFGSHSFLSNLNTKFPFKIEGKPYLCPEQYFQSAKAIHFNDLTLAEQIYDCKDPHEMVKLGKQVAGFKYSSWMSKAQSVLRRANEAKFSQNEKARDYLLETDKMTIAEASPNLDWGTGIKLNTIDVTNVQSWKGKNYMGKILMDIRNCLRQK